MYLWKTASTFVSLIMPYFFKVEFSRGLVMLVLEKMYTGISEMVYDEHIFSHFIDETLTFDRQLRTVYAYPSSQPGPLHILVQDHVIEKWILIEKKCKFTLQQLGVLVVLIYCRKRINTLRPRQNGRHFTDDTFKCIFLNENIRISIKISLKFVSKGPINSIPALVQIMAWRRPGGKSLSEPMMVRLLTHICLTQPQWIKFSLIYQHLRWHRYMLQKSFHIDGVVQDCSISSA